MVRYAAQQIQNLCPQVINAARILASRPRSKVAQENMDVFKVAWESQVQILTDAIDDIVTVDDFLAVSENHILEDATCTQGVVVCLLGVLHLAKQGIFRLRASVWVRPLLE